MSLEERYTKAMELAGYERTEVVDDLGIYTISFRDKSTSERIQTDGWEALADVLQNLEPLQKQDIEKYDNLINPKGRIVYYTKNLGGTGRDKDLERVVYPDIQSAALAYLSAEVDKKRIGYLFRNEEREISYFDIVDMKNHMVNFFSEKLYEGLTKSERLEIQNTGFYIRPILAKDNVYNAIVKGFTLFAHKSAAEMISSKSEWGCWGGRIANSHRPQDYIDVDITGYSTHHEVIYSINVVHANEIVDEKQYIVNTEPDNFEESIRSGMINAAIEFKPFFSHSVDLLDTDILYPMELYSPYTQHKLENHYLHLENAGYEKFPKIKKTETLAFEEPFTPHHRRCR